MRPHSMMLFVSLAVAACGDDDPVGATDAGPSDAGPADAGREDAGPPPPTLTLSGRFTSWPGDLPMSGARICWRDARGEVCANADALGMLTLAAVPANADGALFVDGTDVIPTILPMVLGASDFAVHYALDRNAFIDDLYASASVAADPGRGIVAIQVLRRNSVTGETTAVRNATVGLSPGGWEGPFYPNSTSTGFDLAATGTTEWGVVCFMAVDPAAGPFTITATDAGGTPCTTAEYGVELPDMDVVAGSETHVRVLCN